MSTSSPARWAVPGTSFAVWGLAAASAVAWGLKLSAPAPAVGAPTVAPHAPLAADPSAIARLLGSSPVQAAPVPQAPALASRLSLAGVVAGRSRAGVALLSVDGRPAKPFRVGAVVVDNVVLQSVEGRRAVLGSNGQALVTLELPRGTGNGVSALPPPVATPLPGGGFAPGMPTAPGMAPGMAVSPGLPRMSGAIPGGVVPGAIPGAIGVQPAPAPTAEPR